MKLRRLIQVMMVVTIPALMIMLTPPNPASAAIGTIDIHPTAGPVKTTVNISGSDFTPNKNFTVKFGIDTVKSGVTDASGGFTAIFTFPELPGGKYAVTVTTDEPDTSDTKYFTITPELELGSTSGSRWRAVHSQW